MKRNKWLVESLKVLKFSQNFTVSLDWIPCILLMCFLASFFSGFLFVFSRIYESLLHEISYRFCDANMWESFTTKFNYLSFVKKIFEYDAKWIAGVEG